MWYCMKACDAIVSNCTSSYGNARNIVYCYAYICFLWHYKKQKMIWWSFLALRRKMQEKFIIIIWYTFESSR